MRQLQLGKHPSLVLTAVRGVILHDSRSDDTSGERQTYFCISLSLFHFVLLCVCNFCVHLCSIEINERPEWWSCVLYKRSALHKSKVYLRRTSYHPEHPRDARSLKWGKWPALSGWEGPSLSPMSISDTSQSSEEVSPAVWRWCVWRCGFHRFQRKHLSAFTLLWKEMFYERRRRVGGRVSIDQE